MAGAPFIHIDIVVLEEDFGLHRVMAGRANAGGGVVEQVGADFAGHYLPTLHIKDNQTK